MRCISKRKLTEFWDKHPEAHEALATWFHAAASCRPSDFNDLKQTFGSADYVPTRFTVFDVGGNKYRVVTVIHYNTQIMYIRHVFTHTGYDKWTKLNRGK